MSVRKIVAGAVVGVLTAFAATSAQGSVVLRLQANSAGSALKPPFTIDAQRVEEDGFGPPISFRCPVLGDCTVDVKEGAWVFSSGDAAVYAPPRSITVMPPPSSAPVLTMRLYPAVKVTGEIKEPEAVKAMSLEFRGEGDDAVSDRAQCAIAERQFSCVVPAGTWDLRTGVAGHVPRYLWAFEVRTDKPSSLGTLLFKRGASLSGRVELERGFRLKNVGDVRVTLSPAAGVRTAEQHRAVTVTTRPNNRGFFHFDGVPAGEYVVRAFVEGAVSEPQTARVIADREADLRHPLRIAAPKTIAVRLMPIWSPSGKPWRVRLSRRAADEDLVEVTEAAADLKGDWQYRGASPGIYRVSVLDETGSTLTSQETEVRSDVDLLIPVELTSLTGELRMGDQPIAGKVTFRGPAGTEVVMTAKEDGTFAGNLPAPQTTAWTATIESPALGVHRELRNVRPTYTPEGHAHVLLALPRGQLDGKVVREDGSPIDYGWVNVTSGDGTEVLMQPQVDTSGRFILNGLPAGEYSLQAHTVMDAHPMLSDVVRVSLGDDRGEDLTLTVRRDRVVRGIVVSQSSPVVGASVFTAPTDREWLFMASRTTDLNGRFETLLPHGTNEVDVFVDAPGFAKRLFHTRLGKEDLTIRIAQSGGGLRLTLAPWRNEDPRAPHPWLLHDGATRHVLGMGREQWGEERVSIDAGHVDPGVYTLCLAMNNQLGQMRAGNLRGLTCTTAMVPPFGQTELRLGPNVER